MLEYYRQFTELKNASGAIYWAIGVFDGLHLGHQAVIQSAVAAAHRCGARAGVLTFANHPLTLVRPDLAPAAIIPDEKEKLQLLAQLGVDLVLNLEFTSALAGLEPYEFIQTLCTCSDTRGISIGEDWHFGRGGVGNVCLLREFAQEFGFDVTVVAPVIAKGARISSTRIRKAIQAGQFSDVAAMLTRPYAWFGEVIQGKQLARTLNYPTANIRPTGVLPPFGVYAVRVEIRGEFYFGVANLGIRPTVAAQQGELMLEVHIFDFDSDIYGEQLCVQPIAFLRPECKFASLVELQAQLANDSFQAKSICKGKNWLQNFLN